VEQIVVLILPNIAWSKKNKSVDWTIWPISLCTFAAVLEPEYNVKIIDANIDNLSEEALTQRIQTLQPLAVGISVFCDDYADGGHTAARIVKSINTEVPVVMGGSYVTLNPDVATKDDNIDYFVVGEGEFVFKAILDYLSGSTETLPDCGVIYRTADGLLVDCSNRHAIECLDQLPFPEYGKIDFFKYATKEERNSAFKPPILPYGRITTSRGCPFSCCFCQVEAINGAGIRYRSVANVLNEVEMLIKRYQIKSLLVDDANFTANQKRAKAIIRGFIERQFTLQWRIQSLAAYTLDTELLELMLASGCNHVDLAIESGSQRVLSEIIRKPLNLNRVVSLLDTAKALGFMISANFIIGLPGETWEEIRQTIRFAEAIDVDYVKIMVAMPLRHTKLYEIAHDGGYLRKDFDFFNMRWGVGEISTEEFTNLDTTILRTYEWDRINFSSAEKILRVARVMGVDEETIVKMRVSTRKSLEQLLSAGNVLRR